MSEASKLLAMTSKEWDEFFDGIAEAMAADFDLQTQDKAKSLDDVLSDEGWLLCVYGTLRKGGYNFEKRKENIKVVAKDLSFKDFEMYDLGGYPAAVPKIDNSIKVDIILITDEDSYREIDYMETAAGYESVSKEIKLMRSMVEPEFRQHFTTSNEVEKISCRFYKYADSITGCPKITTNDWLKPSLKHFKVKY
jgi:gamma-glutamylcyclotransferase (GGCT)/AIG2-like uncharacterized protein YtfP